MKNINAEMFSVLLELPIELYGMDPTLTSSVDQLTAGNIDIEAEADTEAEVAKQAAHHEYAEALSLSSQQLYQRHQRHWGKKKHTIRNFLSLGAILFALMLIVGAIYMHLRQKHHLGRLHIYPKEQQQNHFLNADNETFTGETIEAIRLVTAPSVAAQITTTTDKSQGQLRLLDDECLACIALVATGNKPAKCSGELNCGIYRISRWYFQDAQQRLPESQGSQTLDYEHCVAEDKCAERIVRGYVERYERDCNRDGLIECRDHVMLHLLGPNGCLSPTTQWSLFEQRLQMCGI